MRIDAPELGREITAMVTPFDSRGEVSVERTRGLANHLVATGTKSIVVAGTTGESPGLSALDRAHLIYTVLREVDGRAKVIAGTSNSSTEQSVQLSIQAGTEGVDAVLLVTPPYVKPSQDGLREHFGMIAAAVPNISCILYNVPGRTGVNMEAETVLWLDANYTNIVGLKEAAGITGPSGEKGRAQVAQVLANKSPKFQVWSGNDQDTLPMMDMGAYGVISVASHVAGDFIRRMIQHHVAGEAEQALQMHQYLMPLFEALFPPIAPEPSPSSVKALLNMTGILVGDPKRPVLPAPDNYRKRLQALVADYHLLPQRG